MGKKETPIINDFRSGELTPDLDARADIMEYYKGCRVLVNAMPLMEGGVERVPGTVYVRSTKRTEEGWRLAVFKTGSGTGTVTSDLAGINCGSECAQFYAGGATVVLTATPDKIFVGWTGDGTGTTTRTVVMDGNKVVSAEFINKPQAEVAIEFDPLGGWLDGDYLYIVGQKDLGGGTYAQAVCRIHITTMTMEETMVFDYGPTIYNWYRAVCIQDEFAYLMGSSQPGVVGSPCYYSVRKVYKYDLDNEMWNQDWYAPDLINTNKTLTDGKVEGDAVYVCGNAGSSGSMMARYVADGSSKWGWGGIYSNYQGVLMVPTSTPGYSNHVDSFGSSGGILMLHRRLRSNGNLTKIITYGTGYNFYFGCPGVLTRSHMRFIASNYWYGDPDDWKVVLYGQDNIDPDNIGSMWSKNIRPAGGYNHEYGMKPCTDDINVYVFGIYYKGASDAYGSFLAGIRLSDNAELFCIQDLWPDEWGYAVCEVSSALWYGGVFVARRGGNPVVQRRKITDGTLDTP